MPITLGILAQSRQVVDTGAFVLLESTVLTGSQASVAFTSLTTKYAATYQHLQVRWAARTDRANTNDRLYLTFNGDTGNNVYTHQLFGNGSSVSGGAGWGTTDPKVLMESALLGSSATANSFGAGVMDVLDPFETTKNKTVRALFGNTIAPRVEITSAVYLSTSSITSLSFSAIGSLVSGSRFSLYGIKATA
jgi:hypothetical protein